MYLTLRRYVCSFIFKLIWFKEKIEKKTKLEERTLKLFGKTNIRPMLWRVDNSSNNNPTMAQRYIAIWDIIPLLAQYPQIPEKFPDNILILAECNTICSLNVEKTLLAQCIRQCKVVFHWSCMLGHFCANSNVLFI